MIRLGETSEDFFWLCRNIYIYICVCVCVCVYIYIYIYMWVCVCVFVCLYIYIYDISCPVGQPAWINGTDLGSRGPAGGRVLLKGRQILEQAGHIWLRGCTVTMTSLLWIACRRHGPVAEFRHYMLWFLVPFPLVDITVYTADETK